MLKKQEKAQNKNVRKSKDWSPNSKQIKMAQLLLNPEDRRTKQEKCNEVGITHKTLWEWMKNRNFVEYINSQLDQLTNVELVDVWKALIMQCKRGNIQAIKLFFEMKMMLPELKHKVEHDNRRLEIEEKRYELERLKAGEGSEEEVEDDGFLDALKGTLGVWEDGDN